MRSVCGVPHGRVAQLHYGNKPLQSGLCKVWFVWVIAVFIGVVMGGWFVYIGRFGGGGMAGAAVRVDVKAKYGGNRLIGIRVSFLVSVIRVASAP